MVNLSRYVCDKWARSNTLITFLPVNVFPPHNSITMALYRARWRHKSPASRLFTHPFIHGADQSKHQSSKSLAFMRGIHRWPVNSPHKGPVTRKMLFWWSHRVTYMVIHNLVKHADIISAFCIDLANRNTEISEKAIRIDSLHHVCYFFFIKGLFQYLLFPHYNPRFELWNWHWYSSVNNANLVWWIIHVTGPKK